jgi:ribosome biogenesis protein NSA1
MVGLATGKVSLWSFTEDKNTLEIETGKHLSKVQQCLDEKNIFATGGKENDLKIWNLNSTDPTVPTFKARNVPHDFLDLRIPVWVQDLTFMPQSNELVGLCSRYGHVRFYDPKVDNKGRPVINMDFMDHSLMSISATRNNR